MNAGTNTDQISSNSAEKTIVVIGFGRRLIATVVDGLMVVFFTFLLTFIIGFIGIFIGMYLPDEPPSFERLIILCGFILSVAYYVGSWATSGQTIGKTLTGIKVIGTDGSSVSWGQALLRYVGYIVSGVVFSLGFLWIAFERKRQGWHDKIGGTYVVYVEESFSKADALKFVPSDPERSWIWLVIWVVLVIGLPTGFVTSLWFLGPVINRGFSYILNSLL